jgi:hypothetical protein
VDRLAGHRAGVARGVGGVQAEAAVRPAAAGTEARLVAARSAQ